MKRPIALLLWLLALGGPARAFSVDAEHRHLIDTMGGYGVRTYVNHAKCADGEAYGFTNGTIIGLCADIAPDRQAFLTTIRHEAVHIAQYCLARVAPATDPDGDGFSVLSNDVAAKYWGQYGSQIALHYERYDWMIEAEAFGYSNDMTASQITHLVNIACN